MIGSCSDATMGSFDGAEICELVRLYIQSKLEKILPKSNFGLYIPRQWTTFIKKS